MALYQFSIAHAYAKPKNGLLATDPTPQEFGVVQSASVDFKQDLKDLIGNRKFPVDIAAGKTEISGKVEFAQLDINLYNNLFFAGTITSGTTQFVNYETHSVPSPSGP